MYINWKTTSNWKSKRFDALTLKEDKTWFKCETPRFISQNPEQRSTAQKPIRYRINTNLQQKLPQQ